MIAPLATARGNYESMEQQYLMARRMRRP
jgi:hypothetical protein